MSADRDNLCVVLVATRNPLNLGAAARAMSNFGFRRLRVVNPYELAFREARSAVGASDLLAKAEEFPSVADAVADCTLVVGTTAARGRELQHTVRTLSSGAALIRKRLAAGRVALLFGSEKRGLANADFSHCHWLLRIPTTGEHPSMNLGHAVAVCLYELSRVPHPAPAVARAGVFPTVRGPRPSPVFASAGPCEAGDLERLTALLLDTLRESGYLKPRAGAETEEKIRRLVRRLGLTAADAQVWLGIFRQIAWKLRRS